MNASPTSTPEAPGPRLGDLAPGAVAKVLEIDVTISRWRERLIAYGLSPGREVEVVQQSPVTVVRVERIDLAFESQIAAGILVSPATVESSEAPGSPCATGGRR